MKKIFVIFLIFIYSTVYPQDPQFSQYYSAPLLLNPAMAGGADCYRAGFNARSQWTGLPGGAFNTASAYVDLNYPDLRSGFGLMVLRDVTGTPRLSSNEISGFYSYLVPVTDMINFRFGLQGTFASRSLDYSRLIFEDQFSGITISNPTTIDPVSHHRRVQYADISAGGLLFGEEKYWIGFSGHHLSRPQQGFYTSSRLPIKYSIHGGYNFYIKNLRRRKGQDDTRVIPTFMFKSQSKYDQLDLGIYVIKSNFLMGAWYRGIPIKKDYNIYNKDAINLQAGYQYNNFSFTYSYDFTISSLSIVNTLGSHEVSLVYLFCLDWPKRKKPPKHVRKLPCPDFQRSLKYKGNF